MDFILKILCAAGAAVAMVGTITLAYNIYKMVSEDAASRNIKKPKLWGAAAMGDRGGTLLLYLFYRRKYPVINLTEEIKKEIENRKKKIGVSLIFIVIGVIIIILSGFTLI